MANHIYSYFYSPAWDYPPEGPIKVGNVITSILKPDKPLYTAPHPSEDELWSSEKKGVEISKEKLRAGKFAILTKFLSIFGVGIDVGVNWDKSNEELYTFERIDTIQFTPKEEYLQKCVEAETVARYLEKSRYRKPVYVITGVKIATGAKAKSAKARAVGGNLGVEADGTLLSGGTVPVGGGAEVKLKREDKEGTSWEMSSDFVFAFRVTKVKVEKRAGELTYDDFRKSAMLGTDKEDRNREVPLSIIAVEEPEAKEIGFDKEELAEDDEVIACAIPKSTEVEE